MTHRFDDNMEATRAAKMAKITGSSKNYESQGDKADRRYGKLRRDTTVSESPVKVTSPKGS
jgi:hypothetical protein